ncbi:MAG: type IX secretion system membrane protein PorP/SprF [Bacteroidales bacterium]|nr:type IX secretion system membrane protein PorP/SprF [Bacteroidales bacterium]
MKYISTVILVLFSMALWGQQFSMPSQPNRNMVYVNPAFSGYLETSVASLSNRSSMLGFEGNFSFQNFEVHAPLKKQSVAIGLQALHQQIGSKSSSEVFFNYAFRIVFENSKLVFALKLGAVSTTYGDISLRDDNVDPNFLSNNFVLPNVGCGIAYYKNNFYVGAGIPYLFAINSNTSGNAEISAPDIKNLNYMLNAGAAIPLNNNLRLEPHGILVYYLTMSPDYVGVLNLNVGNKIVFGGGYRSDESVLANLGYFISNQFSLQYSYNYNLGRTETLLKGDHELGLLLYFGYKIKTVSPRNF